MEAHPGWTPETEEGEEGNADLGVVVLVADAPAAPLAFARPGELELEPNAAVRMVGYGVSDAAGTGAGVKRTATTTILEARPRQLVTAIAPSGTCDGDSGGAASPARAARRSWSVCTR